MFLCIMSQQLPGIPGCLRRFGLKNGGVQMKKGVATGSISQIETLLRLSPAADSSHPTCLRIQNLDGINQ